MFGFIKQKNIIGHNVVHSPFLLRTLTIITITITITIIIIIIIIIIIKIMHTRFLRSF